MTGPGGMIVLPVNTLPGGGKKKKKKGKKGSQGGDGVQVNLIVDPTMFGHGPRQEEEDEDGPGNDEHSSSVSFAGRPTGARRPRRRNVFEGLAMEEQWRQARKELKWLAFADCLFLALWGIEFVWILIGERCPPGEFDGWCVVSLLEYLLPGRTDEDFMVSAGVLRTMWRPLWLVSLLSRMASVSSLISRTFIRVRCLPVNGHSPLLLL